MDIEFQSALTRGGNLLTPERIIISNSSVTWKKRNKYLIGVDSITIPREKISSIEIDKRLIGADIVINSFGGSKIIAKNFSGSDADQIKDILSK
jgi:hypothetical protein